MFLSSKTVQARHGFFCLFFKVFGGHMSFLGATGTPVLDFWVRSQSGFCLVMYIPRDPPLVLHLPTSWQSVRTVNSNTYDSFFKYFPHLIIPYLKCNGYLNFQLIRRKKQDLELTVSHLYLENRAFNVCSI